MSKWRKDNDPHKLRDMRRHAKQRAAERYGIDLNNKRRIEFLRKIWAGDAVFLERQSQRVTVFLLIFRGKRMPVVYDKKRQEIVTFLPQAYLDKFEIEEDIEQWEPQPQPTNKPAAVTAR